MSIAVTRKSGDTLFLSGTLTGTGLPAVPWVGATAKMSIKAVDVIRDANGLQKYAKNELIVNKASLTTFDTTTLAWTYQGAALAYAGNYAYEIEVTYADATIETFPNNESMTLTVVAQVA